MEAKTYRELLNVLKQLEDNDSPWLDQPIHVTGDIYSYLANLEITEDGPVVCIDKSIACFENEECAA